MSWAMGLGDWKRQGAQGVVVVVPQGMKGPGRPGRKSPGIFISHPVGHKHTLGGGPTTIMATTAPPKTRLPATGRGRQIVSARNGDKWGQWSRWKLAGARQWVWLRPVAGCDSAGGFSSHLPRQEGGEREEREEERGDLEGKRKFWRGGMTSRRDDDSPQSARGRPDS
ncbi:hypothetical protein BO71DRAFT_130015 [Aspergillus ellipticus CBS 707.79]|uniref:Uncharacterized protein n=1 Tax=Aspergillus ellipticus CBS 707.79 TaxID=1448320 RepID=A0A319EZG2_9EURO|nr:hypothetical protein BO71DRAFT_130015 [Aspergillus ellipticus CBS 707.79]